MYQALSEGPRSGCWSGAEHCGGDYLNAVWATIRGAPCGDDDQTGEVGSPVWGDSRT